MIDTDNDPHLTTPPRINPPLLQTKQIADTALNGAPILRKSKSVLFGTDHKVANEKGRTTDSSETSLRHSGHGLGDFPNDSPDALTQGPGRKVAIRKSFSTTDISSLDALEPTSFTFNSSAGKDSGKHSMDKQKSARGRGLTVIAQTAGLTSHTPSETDHEHDEKPLDPEHLAIRTDERLLRVSYVPNQC